MPEVSAAAFGSGTVLLKFEWRGEFPSFRPGIILVILRPTRMLGALLELRSVAQHNLPSVLLLLTELTLRDQGCISREVIVMNLNVLWVLTELVDGELLEGGVVLATGWRGILVGCRSSLFALKAEVVVGLVGGEAIVALHEGLVLAEALLAVLLEAPEGVAEGGRRRQLLPLRMARRACRPILIVYYLILEGGAGSLVVLWPGICGHGRVHVSPLCGLHLLRAIVASLRLPSRVARRRLEPRRNIGAGILRLDIVTTHLRCFYYINR